MLNVNELSKQLKQSFSEIIPAALEQCKMSEFTVESELGKQKAQEYAKLFDELVSEPLAEAVAGAIDYYVKNISITGTVITAGGPTTQVAKISSIKTPVANGKIPNTLGVS